MLKHVSIETSEKFVELHKKFLEICRCLQGKFSVFRKNNKFCLVKQVKILNQVSRNFMEPPEKFVEHFKKVLEILRVSTKKIFSIFGKNLYKFYRDFLKF